MRPSTFFLCVAGLSSAAVLATTGVACKASESGDSGFDSSGGGGAGAGTTATGDPGGPGVGGFNPVTTGAGGSGPGDCNSGDTEDKDKDGFTKVDGDCNDCDANVNPGAIEVVITEPQGDGGIPEPADEDCDGTVDNALPLCDDNLDLADPDPLNGARAIDLCQQATGKKWGVLGAKYVRADGAAAGASPSVGLLDSFGPNVNVQLGQRMLGISSGHARVPGQPDACNTQTCTAAAGVPPPGFPAQVPGCAGGLNINDDIGLEVQIRSPKNATGYRFLFKFQSFEYPEWVCTTFNDQFIALVDPPPMGAMNGNITFDSMSNPVSVNIAFFDVCDPAGIGNYAEFCGGCKPAPNPYCPSGITELQGTGFAEWGDGGATSWLQTTAPVTGGDELMIRFAIWDTGDMALDSTALVDSFEWIANGGTVAVGTGEIPDPK